MNTLMRASCWLVAMAAVASVVGQPLEETDGMLFREGFDDARLLQRGWYDGERFKITGEGTRAGDGCVEYHWKADTTTPDSSSGVRHLFEPTDTVYLRCYIKLSKGWGWTGRSYHPHLMHFMTTENTKFHGPAASHLTVYIEPQQGRLRLAATDIQNKDAPHGLTQGPLRGGYNGKFYDSRELLFDDDQWHCVEAMFKLNSLDLDADKPNADGVVRGWFDGELVVDRTDVILRSTDFPKMKFNQFLLTPYFGPGLLPHEQTLWIDELAVGTVRLGPLAAANSAPAQDARVRIVAADAPRPQPSPVRGEGVAVERTESGTVRVAAAQARNRTIDWKIEDAAEVLSRVDGTLVELTQIIDKAADAGCDALAFPEDTLGLLKWEAAHPDRLAEVLPAAVARMLERLGGAAAKHHMYLAVCSDVHGPDGLTRNTAFLLGRNGRELGRYHKVNLPFPERARTPGDGFPVFDTADLGTAGMLICYDMVFPESTRCLALAGADVVFVPTMGGAAIGGGDISRAAFRTRAVDNFLWIVVAMRGHGAMIISPQGEVVAEAEGPDGLAIADIDPYGGREGGDAFNLQRDVRGRLFRERVPSAYSILTDSHPPVLDKVPSNVTPEEAIRIFATALTRGEERFNEAEDLARAGKTEEAIRLFEELCEQCRTSWIDRAGRERIKKLREESRSQKSDD
jgi:predicted amidohydrolase